VERVSDDRVSQDLAELEGGNLYLLVVLVLVLGLIDQSIASLESTGEDLIPSLRDKIVLIGEGGVCGILSEWISETISDCDALKVELHVSCLSQEFVGNCRDIVSSITLSGDEEIPTFILWVLLEEAFKHDSHVLSNFRLVSGIMSSTFGVSGTNRLVDIEQVS